jgi:hypothetical protein
MRIMRKKSSSNKSPLLWLIIEILTVLILIALIAIQSQSNKHPAGKPTTTAGKAVQSQNCAPLLCLDPKDFTRRALLTDRVDAQ